jgi:hypothetical protein
MKIDRTILDDLKHFPSLVPPVASVMPFLDLFRGEGEIATDDDDELCYGLECDLPLPDRDDSRSGMHWSANIYEDRVELTRFQKQKGVSEIEDMETLSLRDFWRLLRRISEVSKKSA